MFAVFVFLASGVLGSLNGYWLSYGRYKFENGSDLIMGYVSLMGSSLLYTALVTLIFYGGQDRYGIQPDSMGFALGFALGWSGGAYRTKRIEQDCSKPV